MLRTSIFGSTNIGVFLEATDEYVFLRPDVEEELSVVIEEELNGALVGSTIGGSTTVGSLCTGNSSGIVASGRMTAFEQESLEDATGLSVVGLPGRINAAGNIIVANDFGAVVHPELSESAVESIATGLDVDVAKGTVGGMQTVGSAAVATNNGVLCHPQTTEREFETIESVLDVPADIGTINYGGPLIGAGLVANSNGYIVGDDTTGPELGRIEEALGLLS